MGAEMTVSSNGRVNNSAVGRVNVQTKAKLFRGFGEPSRLAIIEALRGRSRTVSEIVDITGLSQSNVSNHLACLRNCGLLRSHSAGRFVHYELTTAVIDEMLALADLILQKAADEIAACPNNLG